MDTDECVWSTIFDDAERKSLEEGFFVTGFVSIILGLWLNLGIFLMKPSLDLSYRNLLNFTTAACVRTIVLLIARLPSFSSNGSDSICCQFFACLETFLAVFEVESLTHVCIERYVVSKYTTNGWPIEKHHYTVFRCLCAFFASVYSFTPLIGVGRYTFDFTCSFCTFDMVLPESWKGNLVLMIFILRSFKPTTLMFMMLIWARLLEGKYAHTEALQRQKKFTKNVIIVTLVNLFCWSPIAIVRGGVLLAQLLESHPLALASPAFYIKWAMWMHWMAPAVTALTLFVVDCQIRNGMLHLGSSKAAKEEKKKKK